jgi:hypothetical protein
MQQGISKCRPRTFQERGSHGLLSTAKDGCAHRHQMDKINWIGVCKNWQMLLSMVWYYCVLVWIIRCGCWYPHVTYLWLSWRLSLLAIRSIRLKSEQNVTELHSGTQKEESLDATIQAIALLVYSLDLRLYPRSTKTSGVATTF